MESKTEANVAIPIIHSRFYMKKIILFCFAFILLIGCNKQLLQKEVEVTFKYTLSQSGSMTRAGDVYDSFYESFIKSGRLLPSQYSLTISTLDGKQVASFSGTWDQNQPVILATGKYHVVGSSKGGATYNDYYNKAVLVFDEEVEILENSTTIMLHANYDCFLLLFDAAEKTYFKWSADGTSTSGISGDVQKASDYYYIFAQGFNENGYVKWNYGSKENSISMSGFNFQKGCYYYFNDLAGKFEIPKMQPGSI